MNTRKFSLPINILLALAILLSALGLSAGVAQAATCTQWHTVQRGEYLSLIAQRYGVSWRDVAELNNLKDPSRIYAGNRLCITTDSAVIPNTGSSSGGAQSVDAPTFEIEEVVEDGEVTIFAEGFPARADIDILMDEIGARAIDGFLVDTVTTDRFGEFEVTVDIPNSLRDADQIAIRLEAQDTNHFAYGWFYNETSGRQQGGGAIFPDLDDEEGDINVQRVTFQRAADIYQGNGGLYMPASSYTGWAWVLRFEPNETVYARGLDFAADLLEVRMLDDSDDPFEQVFGLNYVYFNLDGETRDAYDDGDLDIFTYNEDKNQWVPCEVQVLVTTKNGFNGRLACVIEDFGLYGMAYH